MTSAGVMLHPDDAPTSAPRDPQEAARAIFLHAGHLAFSATPAEITTILGSCVAVCLFDRIARVGGMNHYMLPHEGGRQFMSARYAGYANDQLLAALLALGAQRGRMHARIFGGARVLGPAVAWPRDLGAANIEAAQRWLAAEGIPIVEQDGGGRRARRLAFRTDTGTVLVKIVQVGG